MYNLYTYLNGSSLSDVYQFDDFANTNLKSDDDQNCCLIKIDSEQWSEHHPTIYYNNNKSHTTSR